jgi:hypothetical protein
MSRFYVGQRVRVNCPVSDCHGAETSIISLNAPGITHIGGFREYTGHEVAIYLNPPNQHLGLVFEPHELEPLTPPSQHTAEESAVIDLLGKLSIPAGQQEFQPQPRVSA